VNVRQAGRQTRQADKAVRSRRQQPCRSTWRRPSRERATQDVTVDAALRGSRMVDSPCSLFSGPAGLQLDDAAYVRTWVRYESCRSGKAPRQAASEDKNKPDVPLCAALLVGWPPYGYRRCYTYPTLTNKTTPACRPALAQLIQRARASRAMHHF
jgi:hypothetical protein